MSSKKEGLAWGPIPSRSLTRIAFSLRVVRFKNGANSPRPTGEIAISGLLQPALQLVVSIFVSWLLLNLFADFGPMKYTSSHGIRHSHADWGLQGSNPFQLMLLVFTIVVLSFLKFSVFILVFKKRVLKLDVGFYLLLASAIGLIFAVHSGDSSFVNEKYDLFISSSSVFSVSLVNLSALLFLGIDSFRTIVVKKAVG